MKKVRFKSLLSMALILMIVFSFPSGVFAETVAEEPATAEESEIIEAAEEETEDYLLTEEPEGEEVVPEEQTEEMILEEEAEESAATEDQEAGAEAEETVASVLPDAEQIPDGLDLDEAAILPEEAETEAAVKPGEMLPEAVKPTDGSAYAVLDDNYDLIFFRSFNTYTNGTETTAMDIYGNTYEGKVYDVSDFEYQTDGVLNSSPRCPARDVVRRIRVADNQKIVIGLTNGTNGGWGFHGGSLSFTFSDCPELVSFNGKGFVVDNVVQMNGMFYNCQKLKELDLSTWNGANVKAIGGIHAGMFQKCKSLETIDLSLFKNAKLEIIDYLFASCFKLKKINLGNLDISGCTQMEYMFAWCESLEELDVSRLNTANIKSMQATFGGCTSLQTLDLRNFSTKYLEHMAYMFEDCKSLKKVDLSSFLTGSVITMNNLFKGCDSLREVVFGSHWLDWKSDACLPSGKWANLEKKVYKTEKELYNDYASNASSWAGTWTRLFDDVAMPSVFYFDPVYWALKSGITTGISGSNKFAPYDNCTRGQVVTFLYRAAGSPAVNTSNAPKFKDVKENDYFYKAVIWAAKNGITSGYTDKNGKPTGKFGPNDPCTRGQVVTFLYRAAGSPSVSASGAPIFSDVKKTDYFYNAVIWAAKKGITSGYSGTNKFGPNDKCTRGQVVTFLYRNR